MKCSLFCISMSIDSIITIVLFMELVLREAVSQQTAECSASYYLPYFFNRP